MPNKVDAVQRLYRKLLTLYPRAFRGRLGESMEQTFDDLYHERTRRSGQGVSAYMLWVFLETAVGILREYLLLISPGGLMKAAIKTFGLSALISVLFNLPFVVMEIVNRREYGEDFPFMLFFVMWLNVFAIFFILMPIVSAWRTRGPGTANLAPAQGKAPLTSSMPSALISLVCLSTPFLLAWLDSLGLFPLDRLVNGPNPEVVYVPGLFINLGFIILQLAGIIIARNPILRTLRSGGNLFAHPVHLTIVILAMAGIAYGLSSLLIDQWPCFIGVRGCD